MLRCGPERYGRHRFLATPVSWAGAEGLPPPHVSIEAPRGTRNRVRPTVPTGGELYDQLEVTKNGKTKLIPLNPEMNAEALKKVIGDITPGAKFYVSSREKYFDYYQNILAHILGPEWKSDSEVGLPKGRHTLKTTWHFTLSMDYFRAVAKISFHYFLTYAGLANGDEPCFQELRDFIRYGKGKNTFVFPGNKQFDGVKKDEQVKHILAVGIHASTEVVGLVCLFWHLENDFPGFTVQLGRLSKSLALEQRSLAHAYIYDDPVPKDGKAGEVKQISAGSYKGLLLSNLP